MRPGAGKKQTVYLETSVVSYLAAWPSRDVVKLAKQNLTRQWWEKNRDGYDLYVSASVRKEAQKGDRDAARRRLGIVDTLPVLQTTDAAKALASRIVGAKILPEKARMDILHMSVAAVHGMDYLVTWNCRHIDNPILKKKIREEILRAGYTEVEMTTPEKLWRDRHGS